MRSSLATLQVRCVAASSKTRPVTAGARAIPSIKSGFFCAPHTRKLTPRQQERLRAAFAADEAHISVDVAYQYHLSAVDSLENQLQELEAKRAAITAFHQYCGENPAISYTPEAWRALVDHATIHPDGTIAIAFNDG